MRKPLLLLAASAMMLTGCNQNSGQAPLSTNSTSSTSNHIGFVTAPVDYINSAVKADKAMTKTIDVTYLNEAVTQFNVQEGHYPATLQELVPNYVAKLPTPPFGTKLDYDSTKGVVTVVQQ